MTSNGTISTLSERDEAVLAFERKWYAKRGSKEASIRETFGLSPTRYFQVLNALLDDPEAMMRDPQVVSRLRRLRATRQLARRPRRNVFGHCPQR